MRWKRKLNCTHEYPWKLIKYPCSWHSFLILTPSSSTPLGYKFPLLSPYSSAFSTPPLWHYNRWLAQCHWEQWRTFWGRGQAVWPRLLYPSSLDHAHFTHIIVQEITCPKRINNFSVCPSLSYMQLLTSLNPLPS